MATVGEPRSLDMLATIVKLGEKFSSTQDCQKGVAHDIQHQLADVVSLLSTPHVGDTVAVSCGGTQPIDTVGTLVHREGNCDAVVRTFTTRLKTWSSRDHLVDSNANFRPSSGFKCTKCGGFSAKIDRQYVGLHVGNQPVQVDDDVDGGIWVTFLPLDIPVKSDQLVVVQRRFQGEYGRTGILRAPKGGEGSFMRGDIVKSTTKTPVNEPGQLQFSAGSIGVVRKCNGKESTVMVGSGVGSGVQSFVVKNVDLDLVSAAVIPPTVEPQALE